MKKKIISTIVLITLLASTCMMALAEEENAPLVVTTESMSTASKLKSKGAIVYQNGTDSVVIDSDDLYTLADAFDTFKAAVYWQMAEMNTYLTTEGEGVSLTTNKDIHAVHLAPSDMVDPYSVNFDTLVEGLAASQSIPYNATEYGYAEGTNLYRTEKGRLTTEASNKTEMIEIEGATENSLSAGTAAWIDGELILGTGADNEAYYNQGYIDGFNQKQNSNASVQYIYHRHSETCGPRTCTVTITYSGTFPHPANPNIMIAEVHTRHSSCGRATVTEYKTPPNVPSGWSQTHTYYVNCNKSEGQLEGATIVWK